MSKLSLTCACGQEMVVPETALGRSGLCPGCGKEIHINNGNTAPYQPTRSNSGLLAKIRGPAKGEDQTERWRRFAAAVDLYNARRYAEALTILNDLLHDFPGNPHVETARNCCVRSLREAAMPEHRYEGKQVEDESLNADLVKSVILDKMCNAADEATQLRAADMAARMLGLYGNGQAPDAPPDEPPDILLNPRAEKQRKDPLPRPQLPRREGDIQEEIP